MAPYPPSTPAGGHAHLEPLTFQMAVPDLGAWRQGNTGVPGVWHFDSGAAGRHVLISALIHGNELCGAWALKSLLEAGVRPEAGRLTLMFANLAAFDRFDPKQHDAARFVEEDMNRQWSTQRMADPVSLERRRVRELAPWVEQADWLLDIHSMHEVAPPLLLTGLQPRNVALARLLGNPAHIVVDGGHQDGVRMRDYGRFGLPDAKAPETRSLLIECGFHGDPASIAVAQDLCVRFLETAGVLPAATLQTRLPQWRRESVASQWALQVDGAVVARSERFRFHQAFQGLECIPHAGTVIGDNDGEAVVTPYDDCVLVMPSVRQAKAGVTVVRFAHRSPLI